MPGGRWEASRCRGWQVVMTQILLRSEAIRRGVRSWLIIIFGGRRRPCPRAARRLPGDEQGYELSVSNFRVLPCSGGRFTALCIDVEVALVMDYT